MDKNTADISELIKHIPVRRRTEFTNYFTRFPELIEVYKNHLNRKREAFLYDQKDLPQILKEQNHYVDKILQELAEKEE